MFYLLGGNKQKKQEEGENEDTKTICVFRRGYLCANKDVVDGDVDELDKVSDKAHDEEADGCSDNDLLVFLLVGLGATTDHTDTVLRKLLQRSNNCVYCLHFK